MAQSCTICSHPERDIIDRMIAQGAGYRPIASRFDLGYRSVHRHAERHVPALFLESERIQRRDGLLGKIDELRSQLQAISLENNLEQLAVIDRRLKVIDHEAKLVGAYTKDKDNPETVERDRKRELFLQTSRSMGIDDETALEAWKLGEEKRLETESVN